MTDTVKIDENLYSRQLYVLGPEAMKKMANSNVLIAGQGGLGVEIAKNVALAGVKSLTVQDSKACTYTDLSTQFFLSEQDIGKNRAEVSGPRLNELNPYCPVHVVTDALDTLPHSFFDQFAVVCLTEAALDVALRINDYCRQQGIKFVMADALGIMGSVFVDVGTTFEILDPNGEELVESLVAHVSNAAEGVVTVLPGTRHGLTNDDFVTFTEVEGMTELNGTTHRVKYVDAGTFKIGDTSKFGAYVKGGVAKQVRAVEKIAHKSLRDSLAAPDVNIVDFSRMEAPLQLLLALKTAHAYRAQHGALPGVWDTADAGKFLALAQEVNASFKAPLDAIDTALLTRFAYTSRGALVGISAFLGGMVAQEVLKAVSGKFTPLKQWLLFDVSEVVPELEGADAAEFAPRNDRLDGQRIVLGQRTCDLLAHGRLFMIGCGAIGCEMLKNFAMMGFGTAADGLVSCTDNDLIEKSNLNRQFLFRAKDIGQPKSVTAAKAAQAMNPAMRVEARTDKVCADTENIFTDAFFQAQSVIVNALDNVEARMYVDKRCVDNGKALMESGTMGTKGHVQNILPDLTANYSMTQDPPEGGIPFCTLKSFPYKTEHTIQWARDKFQSEFTLKPTETNQFLTDCKKDGYWDKFRAAKPAKPDVAKAIRLLSLNPKTFADCVQVAVNKFHSYYRNQIVQLLYNYPPDCKDKEGRPFWSAPRRLPRPLTFNANDELHLSFVYHCAHLYANIFQLKDAVADIEQVRQLAKAAIVKEYVIKTDKHIESDESAKKEEALAKKRERETYSGNEFEEMVAEMQRLAQGSRTIVPEDFEKDVDDNHHIDFITAAANLRNVQYGLEVSDRLKTKKIAGRIIPAMATSTSAVSGLVSVEMIKVLLGIKDLTKYKNAWVNLALPAVLFSEPQPCPVTKIHDELTVTLWTKRWEVRKGNLALGQFLNHFKKEFKLNVTGIFHNVSMIYAEIMPDHKKRIPVKMTKLLGIADNDPREFVDLTCSFERLDGTDVTGPTVRYYLH